MRYVLPFLLALVVRVLVETAVSGPRAMWRRFADVGAWVVTPPFRPFWGEVALEFAGWFAGALIAARVVTTAWPSDSFVALAACGSFAWAILAAVGIKVARHVWRKWDQEAVGDALSERPE